MEIAVVRKLVKSQTYFITISEDIMPKEWKEVAITIAPLSVPWGKKITIIKKIGESRLYNSIKIVIPKPVVEHLGLEGGDYAWFRFIGDGSIKDEPPFPQIPYMADIRRIHGYMNSHFVLISKTYLNKLIDSMGRDKWSGKVYLAFKAPTGDIVRLIVKPKDYKNYRMYHVILPHDEIEYILEKTPLKGKKVYLVVAPLPVGYNERILVNPPPTFPL
jgi:hypothetical protein